ncbi:MAG: phosphoglucomutase/phosphomannomutase family protein [Dehalococcoidia bacterium]
MSSPIRFGTDGWRGIIAEDFTFANVRVCAQSVSLFLQEAGLAERGLVVGYDTRFGSEDFAAAASEVIAANDIQVYLCDRPTPTPVVAYSILSRKAGGAVVITASHNPPRWSGFKFRSEYAGSAPPEVLSMIEARVPEVLSTGVRRVPLTEAIEHGLVEQFDPRPAYTRQIEQQLDLPSLRQAGLKIVVDSMHGAAAGYLAGLLEGGETQVWEMRKERNPAFPGMHNPEPIERNLGPLIEEVRHRGADVGLATDGDGDRLGVVDEKGRYVDQLQTFGLLTYYLLEVRGLRGPIVKSVTTTRMVRQLAELYGVPLHETSVGFKYLGPRMVETDALIAGEESGGYAFRGHLPERDAVLSGLYFLDFLARRRAKPSQLLAELYDRVGPHYYGRIDVVLTDKVKTQLVERAASLRPRAIAGLQVVDSDSADGRRFIFANGWALIRFSGTEPLLRIYTEVPEEKLVKEVLEACRQLLEI